MKSSIYQNTPILEGEFSAWADEPAETTPAETKPAARPPHRIARFVVPAVFFLLTAALIAVSIHSYGQYDYWRMFTGGVIRAAELEYNVGDAIPRLESHTRTWLWATVYGAAATIFLIALTVKALLVFFPAGACRRT